MSAYLLLQVWFLLLTYKVILQFYRVSICIILVCMYYIWSFWYVVVSHCLNLSMFNKIIKKYLTVIVFVIIIIGIIYIYYRISILKSILFLRFYASNSSIPIRADYYLLLVSYLSTSYFKSLKLITLQCILFTKKNIFRLLIVLILFFNVCSVYEIALYSVQKQKQVTLIWINFKTKANALKFLYLQNRTGKYINLYTWTN